VSAKDKATGKEQSIVIRDSTALSEEEKERMVREAQEHAEEDRRRRELIETKNQADNVIYATEKALKEYGDKISESEKKEIQDAIEELRKAMQGENAQEIREKISKLSQVSQKLGQAVYQQAQQQGAATSTSQKEEKKKKEEDNITDADYKIEE